ncbi:MAG: serine/threonine-protein kinase [Chlamydiota bacterium]
MISSILITQTSNSKPNNYTSPVSNQDVIVTRVRSKSFEQTSVTPKLKRSYSLSDLDTLSAASKNCTHVLITSPKSNTDKFCVKKILYNEFKEEYASNASLWGFSPCTWSEGNFYYCLITPTEAIKIRKEETLLSDYHRGLEIEKTAAVKTSASNLAIGLSVKKIRPLEQRSFYLYNHKSKSKITKINSSAHSEEALLEDCTKLKFSSKEELLSFCAYTFYQVDALHKAGIYHMDIKPNNICKNKNNSFTIIDLNDSLNFSDGKVFNRIKNRDYTTSTKMIPDSFIQKLGASRNSKQAQKISRSCDLFATGSTIYQIAYAFSQRSSVEESKKSSEKTLYPYHLSQHHPSTLKDDLELEKTLKIFDTRQKELIKKTMSFDPTRTPTSKALKEAFPIPHIRKIYSPQKKTLCERLTSLFWKKSE